MSRKLLAITISMVFVLALLMAIPFGSAAAIDEYDGTSVSTTLSGSGTESDPYLIQSGADLAFFNANCTTDPYRTAYFKLTNDIKWSSYDGDETKAPAASNWVPSGEETVHFGGTLDGDGHFISGIYVKQTSTGTALFVYAEGKIQNLIIKDSTFDGGKYVSAFVALGSNIVIKNCVSYADIFASGEITGAFISRNAPTIPGNITISRCVNFGNIVSTYTGGTYAYVGGIIGVTNATGPLTITYSANYGNIRAEKLSVAGIAGQVASTTINNCLNAGDITASRLVGGIVGRINAPDTSVKNSINYGTITSFISSGTAASNTQCGGITGNGSADTALLGPNAIVNCYSIEGAAVWTVTENAAMQTSYIGGTVFKYMEVPNIVADTTVVTGMYTKTDDTYTQVTEEGLKAAADTKYYRTMLQPLSFFKSETTIADMGLDSLAWVSNGIIEGKGLGLPTIKIITTVDLYRVIRPFFTYVFLNEDFSVYATGTIEQGSVIPLPAAPTKEGTTTTIYVFSGWTGYSEGMTLAGDVVFSPVFTEEAAPDNPYTIVGEGTVEKPYLISTAAHLQYVAAMISGKTSMTTPDGTVIEVVIPANALTAYYKLTANIDWAEYTGSTTANWTPMASKAVGAMFAGTFDGNKHTISGISAVGASASTADGIAFFAAIGGTRLAPAVVKNLILTNVDNKGAGYVGGIVGMVANYGEILDCAVYGKISLALGGGTIGGIVGGTASATGGLLIRGCVNYAEVSCVENETTAAYAGGIIGRAMYVTGISGKIENCANFGNIVGNPEKSCVLGGIAGQIGINGDESAYVEFANCYNAGNISGLRLIGGVVGRLYGGSIKDSYNIGEVTATSGVAEQFYLVGGINSAYNFGQVINSYSIEGRAKNTSAEFGFVVIGGAVVPERSGAFKFQGTDISDSAIKGASAVANMKFSTDAWNATTGYPTLKGITIVPQYNGQYTIVNPSDSTTNPPVTTEPPVDTTVPPVDTTVPPVDTTVPPVDTTVPGQTTAAPGTEPGEGDGFPTWAIIIIVVAVVAVGGGVALFVIKKK